MAGPQAPTGEAMNARAREAHAARYLLNTLRNLRPIAAGADPDRLRGQFAGIPAVVVGAGPSLDHNIRALRRYADRALIISTDTAWRPLAAAGVDPHIVVALDPTEVNGRHLIGVDGARVPWLFAEASVEPRALAHLEGRVATFRVGSHHPWPWLQAQGIERPIVRVWGSVLTAAYELALTFGCNPIAFAGADLAFTNFQPYCRGTAFEADWAEHVGRGISLARVWKNTIAARTLVWEPGVEGERSLTSPHLLEFRNWIAKRAVEAHDRRTVNASGAGTLCGKAIEQSTLDLVLDGAPANADALRAAIDARLVVQATGPSERDLLDAITATIASGNGDLGAWLEFGGPSLTRAQIAVTAAGRIAGESASESSFWTDPIVPLVNGREHGDFGDAWLWRSRGDARRRRLARLFLDSPDASPRIDMFMRAVTGTLARPVDGPEPRLAFLSNDIDAIEPEILTDGIVRRGFGLATFDAGHAIFTPIGSRQSLLIAADGSVRTGDDWPEAITGEIPWGDAGGALAWHSRHSMVLLRDRLAGDVIIENTPFRPSRVVKTADGSAIWSDFTRGLWEWLPGRAGRFLIDTPVLASVRAEDRGLVLAPAIRDAAERSVRQRLDHEFVYDRSAHQLRRIDAAPEGQCTHVAARHGWTARAFPLSDLVRLDHADGGSLLLAAYSAASVAWAGPSLVVTTGSGEVLLFLNLLDRLAPWRTHCSVPGRVAG